MTEERGDLDISPIYSRGGGGGGAIFLALGGRFYRSPRRRALSLRWSSTRTTPRKVNEATHHFSDRAPSALFFPRDCGVTGCRSGPAFVTRDTQGTSGQRAARRCEALSLSLAVH